MIVPVNLQWLGRLIEFSMDLDTNCPTDHAVLHYIERGIPCEPESCMVMLRVLQEGDLAVDGGANIGFFTLLMSKLVGETGQVLAFEPDRRNLKKLRANLALNKCANVKVVEKALWSSQTEQALFLYDDAGANSMWAYNGSDKSAKVETTTLDQECGECPKLIKLDIEGSELRALRGAWGLLKHRPIIITEMNEESMERAGTSFAELRKMLHGFDCFGLSETGHFPTYIPPSVKMTAVKLNTNVMFSTIGQVQKFWEEAHV